MKKIPFRYIVNRWLAQFGDLIDSIFGIFTFGFFTFNLGMKIRAFSVRRMAKKAKDYL